MAEETIKISNFPTAANLDGTEKVTGLDEGQNSNFTIAQMVAYFLQQLPGVTFTSEEKTKLSGIATSATANASDTFLRARDNHTGTQLAATISDLVSAVVAIMANTLQQGSNVTLSYNEETGKITIAASGGGGLDAEAVRDVIGAAMSGTGLINVVYNDSAETITISTTATQNSTDAALRDRSTHTGTQSADTIVDGSTNKAFTAVERTKLAGIATNATANQADSVVNSRFDTMEDLLDENVLPAQAGNAGKVLTTDGTAPAWEEVEVIPGGTSAQLIQGDGSFVNKSAFQLALTLTTTGSSGAATLIGGTLNIPQYSGGGSAPTGTPRRMAMFDASGALISAPFEVAYPTQGYAEISSVYPASDINYSFGFEFQKSTGKIGPNGYGNLSLRGQNGVGAVLISTNDFFRILNDVGSDTVPEYTDNAAAVTAGRPLGFVYRTGDTLKIVHA